MVVIPRKLLFSVSLTLQLACFLLLPSYAQDLMQDNLLQGAVSSVNFVTSAYKIAPGDVLSFSINEEPDFEQNRIIVRPDGFATIRPIGQVPVAGKNIEELSRYLEAQLTAHINDPQVFINVQEFHIPKVYLFGAVVKPGLYQPVHNKLVAERNGLDSRNIRLENPDLTISSVLSSSGGLAYDADLTRIQVTRRNGQQEVVNLIELFIKGDRSQDIILEEGDAVNVSRVESFPYNDEEFKMLTAAGIYPEKFPVRILGEVEKPGLFYVSADTPYLNTVIALAEGYKRNAVQNAVVIDRKTQNEGVAKIVIDPHKNDFVLRPNDVINIKDSKMAKVIRGGETLSRIAGPFWWISRF